MLRGLALLLRFAEATLKSRRNLLLENSALRHQLLVLAQNPKRPRWNPLDRALWVWLSQPWRKWRKGLWLVQPETVIRWHREGFRLFWKWKSRPLKAGRKAITPDTITLIRTMSQANPLWGAPRIHGELLKLGVIVAQRTVAKYMTQRAHRPSSQNWKTFLRDTPGTRGVGGLSDRSHPELPSALRFLRLVPPTPKGPALQRQGGTLRTLDRPTAMRKLSVHPAAQIPSPGSGHPLWPGIPALCRGSGTRPSPYCAPVALAVPLRGAVNRFGSA